MNLTALPSFVAVDMLVRFRRLSTLVLLGAMLVVAWLWIPDPTTKQALMVIDGRRALYTSGAIGMGTATMATFFIGLFGYYTIANSISRDLRTRCGQIIASTPLSSVTYLFGRFAGNFAYLAMLCSVFSIGALGMVLVRGEAPLEIWDFASQFLLLTTPPLIAVSAIAIFFEVTPILRTRAGDVAFFILWMAILGFQAAEVSKNGKATAWLDLSAFGWMLDQLKANFGTDSIAIGRSTYDVTKPPIRFDGIPFTASAMVDRLKAMVIPLSLLIPSWFLFHRFDPAKISASGTARPRRLTSRLAFLSRFVEMVPLPLPRGVAGGALWDARLTLLERPIMLIGIAAVWIASLSGADAAPIGVIIAGILVSSVAAREQQFETSGLIGSSPLVASRTGLWKLLTSLGLVLLVLLPLILRASLDDPVRAARMLGGVVVIAGAANLLGFLTSGPRTFVAAMLGVVYIALADGGNPPFDFAGMSAKFASRAAIAWGVAAVGLAIASVLIPRFHRTR